MDSPYSCGRLNSSIRLESSGCGSLIQSAIMSMQDVTSSLLGSGVKTGVLSLMRLYLELLFQLSVHPPRDGCLLTWEVSHADV